MARLGRLTGTVAPKGTTGFPPPPRGEDATNTPLRFARQITHGGWRKCLRGRIFRFQEVSLTRAIRRRRIALRGAVRFGRFTASRPVALVASGLRRPTCWFLGECRGVGPAERLRFSLPHGNFPRRRQPLQISLAPSNSAGPRYAQVAPIGGGSRVSRTPVPSGVRVSGGLGPGPFARRPGAGNSDVSVSGLFRALRCRPIAHRARSGVPRHLVNVA